MAENLQNILFRQWLVRNHINGNNVTPFDHLFFTRMYQQVDRKGWNPTPGRMPYPRGISPHDFIWPRGKNKPRWV